MDLVGRWWNGRWGRLVRRDVWLYRQTVWCVVAREGNSEGGRELRRMYDNEQAARDMVNRLMHADRRGEWRDLTEMSMPQRSSEAGDGPS